MGGAAQEDVVGHGGGDEADVDQRQADLRGQDAGSITELVVPARIRRHGTDPREDGHPTPVAVGREGQHADVDDDDVGQQVEARAGPGQVLDGPGREDAEDERGREGG